MTILHTINQSPDAASQVSACLSRVLPDSAVVFYEDGVYAALDSIAERPNIQLSKLECRLYVLDADCAARGLATNLLSPSVEQIDYARFVELVTQYDVVQAWS